MTSHSPFLQSARDCTQTHFINGSLNIIYIPLLLVEVPPFTKVGLTSIGIPFVKDDSFSPCATVGDAGTAWVNVTLCVGSSFNWKHKNDKVKDN